MWDLGWGVGHLVLGVAYSELEGLRLKRFRNEGFMVWFRA